MTLNPMMISVGITTPAIHGSKYTSISCNPRKYHGAFAGFIVRLGLDGSSRGAFSVMDHTIRIAVTMIAARNSTRSKNGHTWTSLDHPCLNGHVLRWWVFASAGFVSKSAISSSLALACFHAREI